MRYQLEELIKVNDKYAVRFGAWTGTPGSETMISDITTGFVYDTEREAAIASEHFLDAYSADGNFPNLSELV